jgi:hypothetical protein
MYAISNDELERIPKLLDEPFTCHRCGEPHPIIDSEPPGSLQAVRCGEKTLLVGINWRKLPPPPKEKK